MAKLSRRQRSLGGAAALLVSLSALGGGCGEPFAYVSPTGGSGGTGGTSATGGSGGGGASSSSSSGSTSSGSTSSGSTTSSSGSSGSSTSSSSGSSGSTSSSTSSGAPCTDADDDGVTTCQNDCNDGDPAVHPGAAEVCGDLIDNDCNGSIDEGCGDVHVYVAGTGKDQNPGTKLLPVATIARGIQIAQAVGNGASVWVASGHYPEDVTLVEGVSLYGGFEPAGWTNNPVANDTAILSQGGAGVVAGSQITRATVLDGFRLEGKSGTSTGGAAPYAAALTIDGGTPTVSRNIIHGPAQGAGLRSVGVVVLAPSNDPQGAYLHDNQISGGGSTSATSVCEESIAVLLDAKAAPPPQAGAAAEVVHNQLRAGAARASRAFVSRAHADGTRLVDNDIEGGAASDGESFGVVLGASDPGNEILVDRNRINANTSVPKTCAAAFAGGCGGLDAQAARARITNNIIYGAAAPHSVAVWLRVPQGSPPSLSLHSNYLHAGGQGGSPSNYSVAIGVSMGAGAGSTYGRIDNNILHSGVAPLRVGISEESTPGKTLRPEKLLNNFFIHVVTGTDILYRTYDGTAGGYVITMLGVNQLPGAANNLAGGDPGLTSATNFHLVSGSPCIDKGTSEECPAKDFEDEARPKGAACDIGPDER